MKSQIKYSINKKTTEDRYFRTFEDNIKKLDFAERRLAYLQEHATNGDQYKLLAYRNHTGTNPF